MSFSNTFCGFYEQKKEVRPLENLQKTSHTISICKINKVTFKKTAFYKKYLNWRGEKQLLSVNRFHRYTTIFVRSYNDLFIL